MQAPRFWSRDPSQPGLWSLVLRPAGRVYAFATARRLRRGQKIDVGVPVICVGNLTAGGNGKTPLVIALCEELARLGCRPGVVSRGYGGSETGPLQVDLVHDTAAKVGDEPLLIAAHAPVWVAKDRAQGARQAAAAGVDVIVLDDGYQDATLHYSRRIITIDLGQGFGNGHCIPSGPLREPVGSGLARADLCVLIGSPKEARRLQETWPDLATQTCLSARIAARSIGVDWNGVSVLAFAGIGRPEKFFQTLRDLGANVVRSHAFADHAPYTDQILNRMLSEATSINAQLVTTDKDAVRLPPDYLGIIQPLPVELLFSQPDLLRDFLIETMSSHGQRNGR